MNDFVINVRQIMEYPLKGEASEADAVLLQTGALGGPYAWTTSFGLVTGALGWPGGQVGVGIPLPGNAVNSGVLANLLLVPTGCNTGYNYYQTSIGPAYLESGAAGRWCFYDLNIPTHPGATATMGFQFAPPGTAGAPVFDWFDAFNFDSTGYVIVGNTMLVARDPQIPLEVATKRYVDRGDDELQDQINQIINNTVWSFNGRRGNVTLFLSDVLSAGGAPISSPQFMGVATAPTPAFDDPNGSRIATIAWVRNALEEENLIGPPGPQGPQGPQGPAGSGASVGFSPPAAPGLGDLWGDPAWLTLSWWDGSAWRRAPYLQLRDSPSLTGNGDIFAWSPGLDGLSEQYIEYGLPTWYYGNAPPDYAPLSNIGDGGRGSFWWAPGTGTLSLNVGSGNDPDWRTINAEMRVGMVVFSTSGTYVPRAGLVSAVVECFGAGGGGGSVFASNLSYAGGGGGSGGYTRAVLSAAQIGASQFVTVAAVTPTGVNGASTLFGTLVTAFGGFAGSGNDLFTVFGGPGDGAAFGALGPGVSGFTLRGVAGHYGFSTTAPGIAATLCYPGPGGSLWGGGTFAGIVSVANSITGSNGSFAAGGSGAGSNGNNAQVTISGGQGGQGLCVITEYYIP